MNDQDEVYDHEQDEGAFPSHGEVVESYDPPDLPTREQERTAGRKISEALDELFGTHTNWALTGDHMAPVHTHTDEHVCKVPLNFSLDNLEDDQLAADYFQAAAEHLRHTHIAGMLEELSDEDKDLLRSMLGNAGPVTDPAELAEIDRQRSEITAKISAALDAEGIAYEVSDVEPGQRVLGFRLTNQHDGERAAKVVERISREFGGGDDAPQAALGQDHGNGGYL